VLGDNVCCVHRDNQRTWRWMQTVKDVALKEHIETYSTAVLDPRELHIEHIFVPKRFDVLTILKALNVRACVIYVLTVGTTLCSGSVYLSVSLGLQVHGRRW